MLHFDNCRTFGNKFGKPTDIQCFGSLIYIDWTYNAMYWIDRLEEELFCTATDRDGNKYKIYRNINKNLAAAIMEG